MTKFLDQPVVKYNEPAIYNNFSGGINTDAANENLLDHELREAVNLHYSNGAIRKRPGAKLLANITANLNNVQGIFLYTVKSIPYIIVASDGQLYQGIYKEDSISLERLPVYLETSIDLLVDDPMDMSAGLPEYGEPILGKHNGFIHMNTHTRTIFKTIEKQVWNSSTLSYDINYEDVEESVEITTKELYFQNSLSITAATYKDSLYIATGTRLVQINLTLDDILQAKPIQPYRPNAVESVKLGFNRLSPFPLACLNPEVLNAAATTSSAILIQPITKIGDLISEYKYTASMLYGKGESSLDYLFKWEILLPIETNGVIKDEWIPLVSYNTDQGHTLISDKEDAFSHPSKPTFNNALISRGKTSVIVPAEFSARPIRCTFGKSFAKDREGNYKTENQDYYIDKADGNFYGSILAITPTQISEIDKTWLQIQTCRKILGDGNKFILYDDAYNSGNWFKTVIGNPGYIIDRNCLNFKTDKNESLVKVIHFQGALVAFAHCKGVGGNISVITGNGDDYPDNNYSPYIRNTVNNMITCDNADTVQVADNYLIFKYFDNVYAIEAGSLNTQVVTVTCLNSKIKNNTRYLSIPWTDKCISEITPEYYALIFNGMRVKLYYKLPYKTENTIYFPWLVDKGYVFKPIYNIHIDGESVHMTEQNNLICFNADTFTDLGEIYPCVFKPKGTFLNYPKLTKYVHTALIEYYRDAQEYNIDAEVTNEVGYTLANRTKYKEPIISESNSIGTLGETSLEVCNMLGENKHPALIVLLNLVLESKGDFSISSVTYEYTATHISKTFQDYGDLILQEEQDVKLS